LKLAVEHEDAGIVRM